MALSISQIMQVAAPAVVNELRRNYVLGNINEREDGFYRTALYDPVNGSGCVIAWTRNDEIRMTSERQRIDFARTLLVNAANQLDFIQRPVEQEVLDVTYE